MAEIRTPNTNSKSDIKSNQPGKAGFDADVKNKTADRKSVEQVDKREPTREKIETPQRPGSEIIIGPEGPYSLGAALPDDDSDAR